MPAVKNDRKLQKLLKERAEKRVKVHTIDLDEVTAGRGLKRRKREHDKAKTATKDAGKNAPDAAPRPSGSGSGDPNPGPASGPSHNLNGSEGLGRKARENFVNQTLHEATYPTNTGPEHAQPAPPESTDEPFEEKSTSEDDTQAQSDSEDVPMNEGLSDDESEVNDETNKRHAALLKRLKELYKRQPTKEMKEAVFSLLEELTGNGAASQGPGGSKRKNHNRDPKSEWVQDNDFVVTDGPQRRDEDRVLLSACIRLIIDELLNVNDTNRLPPGPPPEVAAPTAAAFYLKWDESQKSEFNATAARIVAKRVVDDYSELVKCAEGVEDIDDVFDLVTEHIKYLRTCFRRQNVPKVTAKEPQRHRSTNATSRKHTLYKHRLKIIDAVPALARHGRLIEQLGIEGTSSDEETARKGTYHVKRKKQLSSKVQHLKKQLDQAYAIRYKGPGSKGSQLRRRIDTGLVSTRQFKVTGLPLSCMDPAWLAKLTDVQKELFRFNEKLVYDFSFPVELLETPE
ncbi:hypothetical protein RhiJN_02478 [Ceratobasidium sp. AG-Ba]|nr:hypothetical protein RhiJN_02478 [Ceratobasidium sp. AG-Ba]QRW03406.1 hypothetical protein RhiLY_02405 [Ceratobasidium sp. AG-Ba]